MTVTQAQTRVITGRVTDSSGMAVPAATVRLKGTKVASVADGEGKFSIKAATGDVLVISSSGMSTREVKVGAGTNNVNVLIAYQSQNLSEVTVTTALGIKRQARELGYATAQIKTAELNQAAVINPATGLAAKVSGVDIRLADNGVNPQVKVTFRGNRSISGNNSALIVVDGVPVDQQYLANLNPNDIDDITVLKGSNAAALYGMAASNGVMVISTKKGKGKFSLTYENKVSLEHISYFPAVQNEYGGYGGEGAGTYPFPGGGSVYYQNPFSGLPNIVPFENEAYGAAFNSLDFHPDSLPIGINANQQVIYGPNRAAPHGREDFFQTGVADQNELSASMANSWGGLYISGDHTNKQGTTPYDTYRRDGGRINGTLNFGRFTASGGVSYYNVSTNIAGNSYWQNRPVYWNVINQQSNIDLKDFKNINLFQNNQGFINAYYPNPWVQVFDSRSKNSTDQLLSNLQLNYKFTSWLTATARGGYSRTWADAPSYIDSINFPAWLSAGAGPFGGSDLAQVPGDVGYQQEDVKEHLSDFNSDIYLTATKKYGDFKFNLVGGVNYREQKSYGYWWSNQVNSDPTLIGANVIPSFPTKVTNTATDAAYAVFNFKRFDQSAYGDLTIGYDSWLFLHGSFRNDWTSILAPQSRSFNYPSVDMSAVLSDKISALRNQSVISFLKVRAGYAGTGNVSIDQPMTLGVMGNVAGGTNTGGYTMLLPTYGAYVIYPIAGLGTGYPFGNLNGYSQPSLLVQNNLKPEKTAAEEYGFQLGMFRNRVNLEVNYYDQQSTNQTIAVQPSTAAGIKSFLTNAGKISNSGVEVDLSLNPVIKAGNFHFDLSGNFSYQDSRVVNIAGGQQLLDQMNFGTQNLGGIYAVAGKGYPQMLVTDWLRDPQGHIIVQASNGLPLANPNPVDVGNTNYKYFLGLSPSFSYKNWSLRAVFDYRGGAKILNEETAAMDFAGIYSGDAANRQTFIIPNSVIQTPNGYVPNTSVSVVPEPGYPSGYWYWANVYSQIGRPYVVSADFWKLREIALNYAFPRKLLGSQNVIKRLDLGLIGRNVFMWRPKTNNMSDPEFSTNAIGNAVGYTTEFQTPPTRILTASLRATIF
jgi:TonB-linked SusC/RagA family outer membrane protein